MIKESSNYLSTPGSETTLFIKYHFKRKALEIGFTSHRVYEYHEVPPPVWENYRKTVTAGGSSGIFFNRNIKDKYDYTQLI